MGEKEALRRTPGSFSNPRQLGPTMRIPYPHLVHQSLLDGAPFRTHLRKPAVMTTKALTPRAAHDRRPPNGVARHHDDRQIDRLQEVTDTGIRTYRAHHGAFGFTG